MYLAVLSLCILLCGSLSGLIMPTNKPDGSTDVSSLQSHITLLEQTLTTLQTTTGKLQTDLQASIAQSASLTKEVDALKAELKISSNDIVVLKSEINDMKRVNGNTNNQLNLTILDSISHDVKMNTAQVNAFQADFKILDEQLSLINVTVDDVIRETERCVHNSSSALQIITQTEAELLSTKSLAQNTSQQLKKLEMDLNSTSAGLQNNLMSTNNDVTTLRGDLSAVKNLFLDNMQSLANVSHDLKLVLADLNMTTNTSLETLGADLAVLKNQSGDSQKLVAALASKTGDVAFQVSQPVRWTQVSTPVTFNRTLYNARSAFNTTTGKFSAPESGTYMFWANLETVGANSHMNVYIMKSGNVTIAGGYVSTDPRIDVADAFVVAVDHLNKDEEVWVEVPSVQNLNDAHKSSYFGGVMLSVD